MKNTQYNNIWVIDDTLTMVAFFLKPELFSDPKENWFNLSICSFSSSSLIQENRKPHYDLPILLSPISIFLFESYDIKLNYQKRVWYKINFMYIKDIVMWCLVIFYLYRMLVAFFHDSVLLDWNSKLIILMILKKKKNDNVGTLILHKI